MPLVSPWRANERILVYGSEGTGKTYAWMKIAKKVEGHFWVLDTDLSVIRFLDSEEFQELENKITVATPMDFGEALENVEKWRAQAKNNDWLVIDRVDPLWDEAQEEFSTRVYGASADEHYLAFRGAAEAAKDEKGKWGTSKNPFDGMTDWPTIKKRHMRLMKNVLMFPGHVFLTAAEKELMTGKDMEDRETKDKYGDIGFKPAGEKKNGHLMSTVLRFQGSNEKTWRITTGPKDRQRQRLQGMKIKDFGVDYLMKVAGWKMEKSKVEDKVEEE